MSIQQGKRDRLASWVMNSSLKRLLGSLPRRNVLLVLNYHRVGEPIENPYDDGLFSATAEELDEQIRLLKRYTRTVTLDEAVAIVEKRERLLGTCSLLTFDDGYRDAYDVVFPVLRSHGVQGVFFLATSFVDSARLPWWDAVAFLLKRSRRRQVNIRYPFEATVVLDQNLTVATRRILEIYKTPGVESQRFVRELEEACGKRVPSTAAERLFVSWAEVKEMVSAGMALGAHSHRHELFSKLPRAEQYDEAMRSKQTIAQHAGVSVETLAYPVGTRASFTSETVEALQQAGYRAAFSFYGGTNCESRIEPFDIRRSAVSRQNCSRFECQVVMSAVAGRYWP
jgi:peptidoglycan/xylan/chitin deacetylase (PgdA/CDA1 family)